MKERTRAVFKVAFEPYLHKSHIRSAFKVSNDKAEEIFKKVKEIEKEEQAIELYPDRVRTDLTLRCLGLDRSKFERLYKALEEKEKL